MGGNIATFLTIVTAVAALGAIGDRVIWPNLRARSGAKIDEPVPNITVMNFLASVEASITRMLGSNPVSIKFVARVFAISTILLLLVFVVKSGFSVSILDIFESYDFTLGTVAIVLLINFLCIYISVIQTTIFISLAASAKSFFKSIIAIVSDIFISAHLFSVVATISIVVLMFPYAVLKLRSDFTASREPAVELRVKKTAGADGLAQYEVLGKTNLPKLPWNVASYVQLQFKAAADVSDFSGFLVLAEAMGVTHSSAVYKDADGRTIDEAAVRDPSRELFTVVYPIRYLRPQLTMERIVGVYSRLDSLRDNIISNIIGDADFDMVYFLLGFENAYSNYFQDRFCIDKPKRIFVNELTYEEVDNLCDAHIATDANGVFFSSDVINYDWDNVLKNDIPITTIFTATILVSISLYASILTFFACIILGKLFQNLTHFNTSFQRAPMTLSGVVVGVIIGLAAFI